jgi:hypothetical protein
LVVYLKDLQLLALEGFGDEGLEKEETMHHASQTLGSDILDQGVRADISLFEASDQFLETFVT